MSSVSAHPVSPPRTHHRHSGDSAKFEEALPARIGQPSTDTFYARDDYTGYPNKWAQFRLATGIDFYSPHAYVMSQRDHTRACR
jgi:hypothetical protein